MRRTWRGREGKSVVVISVWWKSVTHRDQRRIVCRALKLKVSTTNGKPTNRSWHITTYLCRGTHGRTDQGTWSDYMIGKPSGL